MTKGITDNPYYLPTGELDDSNEVSPSTIEKRVFNPRKDTIRVEMDSDIQIGAVEIKNYNSDTRVEINPNHALRVFSDEFIDNDTTITRNADGSIATVITTNGSLTKTETIVRNVDGSISQVNITVV